MLRVRQFKDLEPTSSTGQHWEALVKEHPASGFMQSLAWAIFKKKQGYQILHLGLYSEENLIGGVLCYASPEGTGANILVAPEGPVLPWEDEEEARLGLRLLLAEVETLAPRYGVQVLHIEPHIISPLPAMLRNFRPAPLNLQPITTLYLDLRPSPEELLAAMQPKGRYNVRLAARKGITIREDRNALAVHQFYPLLEAASQRDGFFCEPLNFFASLAETFLTQGLGTFIFAEKEGQPLAAMFLVTYGQRATYFYGGIANEARNSMAGYALQWGAINTAKKAGCQIYDFYGYEENGDPTHLYANFSRFKRQFGGRPIRFIDPLSYVLMDRLADLVVQVAREIYEL